MCDYNSPAAYVQHSSAGSGKSSAWGLANIEYHYSRFGVKIYCIEFGVNDNALGVNPAQTLANLIAMYNYVVSRGSLGIIVLPACGIDAWKDDYIPVIEAGLTTQGIPFSKIYDVVDLIPGDDICESVDTNYTIPDGIHPNVEGHRLMGNRLWSDLLGLGWVT